MPGPPIYMPKPGLLPRWVCNIQAYRGRFFLGPTQPLKTVSILMAASPPPLRAATHACRGASSSITTPARDSCVNRGVLQHHSTAAGGGSCVQRGVISITAPTRDSCVNRGILQHHSTAAGGDSCVNRGVLQHHSPTAGGDSCAQRGVLQHHCPHQGFMREQRRSPASPPHYGRRFMRAEGRPPASQPPPRTHT